MHFLVNHLDIKISCLFLLVKRTAHSANFVRPMDAIHLDILSTAAFAILKYTLTEAAYAVRECCQESTILTLADILMSKMALYMMPQDLSKYPYSTPHFIFPVPQSGLSPKLNISASQLIFCQLILCGFLHS